MFSSALKSFTSNITSNYTIALQPTCTAGPWKVFDAKKKGKGAAITVSVFVFDRKSLDASSGGLGGRSGAASLKRTHEEVLERLKMEASSLARLRHPSILELVEPVEETRSGGLMFATELVTVSLAGLLAEKDDQERSRGGSGRAGRYVVEESDGTSRRRELELDELDIQKGLLQIGKGLEFLHQSARLVHGNLTPEAIFVNPKSDWKISGLAFAGSPSDSTSTSSVPPLSLHEALNHDPRLPPSVQLNLDYSSPDFVIDQNVTSSADMFSLGLLIIALYNSPHHSPLETHGSLSSYKRLFASSSTVPTQQNSFLSKGQLPKDLASDLLPRLITRRPAQRLNASEFQQARYFDNILVSTIRFLDDFPAKTPNEKTQFMRGLARIMPQFPRSVLEKKILPVLLDEMKDRDLLAAILQNVFAIVAAMPSGKHAFTDKVIPKLRDVFLTAPTNKSAASERDASKEAGLMIVLENMSVIASNCSGKEFRDDILPMIALGLGSQTHGLVDAALSTLSAVLPVLDYSTIKNELFPVIANVFAHTSSLAIKIRSLEALYTLCGGTEAGDESLGDGLDGIVVSKEPLKLTSSAVLDKFTIQEKVVPLIKSIKTKEPGVMMAALNVLRQVGKIADADFMALEILPVLWVFALGPLLDLQQFQAFMSLIKSLSTHVEREHTKKLQELSTSNGTSRATAKRSARPTDPVNVDAAGGDVDFESLVTGRRSAATTPDILSDWNGPASRPAASRTSSHNPASNASTFAWSTAPIPTISQAPPKGHINTLSTSASVTRTVTPDQSLSTAFSPLTPSTPFSQPLQPSLPASRPMAPATIGATKLGAKPNYTAAAPSSINWSAAANPAPSFGMHRAVSGGGLMNPSAPQISQTISPFQIAPPPKSPLSFQNASGLSSFSIPPPAHGMAARTQPTPAPLKKGLDQYESLL